MFKLIHLLSTVVWVGGMFFAYIVLRPASLETLETTQRLRLLNAVLRRFFNWIWGAIGAILVTGLYRIYLYGGISHSASHIVIMAGLGLVMMAIYSLAFFACYVPFSLHVARKRWNEAGEILGSIRRLVAVNLVLGILSLAWW